MAVWRKIQYHFTRQVPHGLSPLIKRSFHSVIVCEIIQKRQLMRSALASRDMKLVEQ